MLPDVPAMPASVVTDPAGVTAARLARCAGQCRHDAARGDLPDDAVVGVADIDVPRRVHRYSLWHVEEGGHAGAVGASRDAGGAGQRVYVAGGRDHANVLVAAIRHVDVA